MVNVNPESVKVIAAGKLKGTKQPIQKELKLLDGNSNKIDYRRMK